MSSQLSGLNEAFATFFAFMRSLASVSFHVPIKHFLDGKGLVALQGYRNFLINSTIYVVRTFKTYDSAAVRFLSSMIAPMLLESYQSGEFFVAQITIKGFLASVCADMYAERIY